MYCKYCSKLIDDNSSVCGYCGKNLKADPTLKGTRCVNNVSWFFFGILLPNVILQIIIALVSGFNFYYLLGSITATPIVVFLVSGLCRFIVGKFKFIDSEWTAMIIGTIAGYITYYGIRFIL